MRVLPSSVNPCHTNTVMVVNTRFVHGSTLDCSSYAGIAIENSCMESEPISRFHYIHTGNCASVWAHERRNAQIASNYNCFTLHSCEPWKNAVCCALPMHELHSVGIELAHITFARPSFRCLHQTGKIVSIVSSTCNSDSIEFNQLSVRHSKQREHRAFFLLPRQQNFCQIWRV